MVNVRDRGPGLFGCGETKLSGIATVDALSWIVQELNQKIWSGFSPNVSIGKHSHDYFLKLVKCMYFSIMLTAIIKHAFFFTNNIIM